MSGDIVYNINGVNYVKSKRNRSRIYVGYDGNTNESNFTATDQWIRFPTPSGGLVTYRNQDFSVDGNNCKFTYNGANTRWFNITATCNVLKASGAAVSRDVVFQWRLNGVAVGPARETHMNNLDAQIIGGNGELQLSTGDYLEPWIKNKENGDQVRIYNCSFNIVEDVAETWD